MTVTNSELLTAPVNLPYESRINYVEAAYYDNTGDSSCSLDIILSRFNDSARDETIASLHHNGSDSASYRTIHTTNISHRAIDNRNYSYAFEVTNTSSSAECKIANLKIRYTVDKPLP